MPTENALWIKWNEWKWKWKWILKWKCVLIIAWVHNMKKYVECPTAQQNVTLFNLKCLRLLCFTLLQSEVIINLDEKERTHLKCYTFSIRRSSVLLSDHYLIKTFVSLISVFGVDKNEINFLLTLIMRFVCVSSCPIKVCAVWSM